MDYNTTPVKEFLQEHPKWIGVLFWLSVLLMETGLAVAGGGGSSTAGP